MNKNFFSLIVITALFAAIFTSCDSDKLEQAGQIALNLRTDIASSTLKVADNKFQAKDTVGLYMKPSGQPLSAAYSNVANRKMSFNGQNLVTDPPIMYPENGNVDLIAYYPYTVLVRSNFTIDVYVGGQSAGLPTEILRSDNVKNQAATTSPVTLNFRYSLAKIVTTVKSSQLAEADFAGMTVNVEGMYTRAKLQLANGTFFEHESKHSITMRKTSNTATSTTFEALILPTTEPVTFVFNIGGDTYRYETDDHYETATQYELDFTLDVPVRTATLLNATITERITETRSYTVVSEQTNTNVYLAGYLQYPSNVAALWKNGVVQNVTDDIYSIFSMAYSVYATNNNVYVAGYEFNQRYGGVATLWKNGVAQYLTNETYSLATSVYVSGSDVYVAGHEKPHNKFVAKLWKNGVAQNLTNGNYFAEANSVYVSGSDVYVAGYEDNVQNKYVAKLWKNGVAQNLTNGTYYAKAYSVYVSGNDVYVAGYEDNAQGRSVAKIWKNGIAQNLTNGTYGASATSVYVSGSDVYVAGYEKNAQGRYVAKLWKNGMEENLSNGGHNGVIYSVFVK